jgi:hypothetical protein
MLCYLNSPVSTDLKLICGTPCLLSVTIALQPTKWCKSGELAKHVSASRLNKTKDTSCNSDCV